MRFSLASLLGERKGLLLAWGSPWAVSSLQLGNVQGLERVNDETFNQSRFTGMVLSGRKPD